MNKIPGIDGHLIPDKFIPDNPNTIELIFTLGKA